MKPSSDTRSVHQPSPRPYPDRLPEVEYPSGVTVRRVRRTGEFKWRGRLIYLSTVAKETIALIPCDNDRWEIRYSFHPLGVFDQHTQKITAVASARVNLGVVLRSGDNAPSLPIDPLGDMLSPT